MIFTGPVDEYFDYRFGKLPYRSLTFKFETINAPQVQPVAVINYPNENPYTRVTEFKHLTGQEHAKTTLVYEYPTRERRPVLPGSASGKSRALSEVSDAGGVDAERPFRRPPGHLSLLQHGPGHRSGADSVREAHGTSRREALANPA